MENMDFGSATPKQRWALFCLTKKDYRNVVISKEEASEIISNYKQGKNAKNKGENKANKQGKECKYKELSSEELRGEFAKVWGNDAKMVEHCVKHYTTNVRLSNGAIIGFDKKRIETEFWVGYSDCGQGLSYDEANRRIEDIRSNILQHFMQNNMDYHKRLLKKCEDNRNSIWICDRYDAKTGHNFVNFYFFESEFGWEFERMKHFAKNFYKLENSDDIALIKWAIQKDAQKFEKRLNAYIKRFGTSKLRCSSYWIDR